MSVSQLVSVGGFSFSASWAKSGGRRELLAWLESEGRCEWLCQTVSSWIKSQGWSPVNTLLSLHSPTLRLSLFAQLGSRFSLISRLSPGCLVGGLCGQGGCNAQEAGGRVRCG